MCTFKCFNLYLHKPFKSVVLIALLRYELDIVVTRAFQFEPKPFLKVSIFQFLEPNLCFEGFVLALLHLGKLFDPTDGAPVGVKLSNQCLLLIVNFVQLHLKKSDLSSIRQVYLTVVAQAQVSPVKIERPPKQRVMLF